MVRRYLGRVSAEERERWGRVPVFVHKEVDDVESMEDVDYYHRVRDVSVKLVLPSHKREVTRSCQLPTHVPNPTSINEILTSMSTQPSPDIHCRRV